MAWSKVKPTKKGITYGDVNDHLNDRPLSGDKLLKGDAQQEAIWDRFVNGKKHLVVQALAGTGKTTTVCQGFLRMGQSVGSAAFVAFNKSIASELQTRVPSWVQASTFHSMLNRVVSQSYGRLKATEWKTHNTAEQILGEREWYKTNAVVKHGVSKLVSLCKATLTGWDDESELTKEITPDELELLCEKFDIQLNGDKPMAFDLVPQILEKHRDPDEILESGEITFDDMIWLPIVNQLAIPRMDVLAIDEAQDLAHFQQVALLKAGKRIIVVGDCHQAIYGFRGADTESLPRITKVLQESNLGCDVLPLETTRRCPTSHVAMAQEIVPALRAMPKAIEGEIEHDVEQEAAMEQMEPGDLVLCRVNAPIVSMAFKLLRAGKRANIQGRDIGAGLKALVKKLKPGNGPGSVKTLTLKVGQYYENELARINAKKNASEMARTALEDKVLCVYAFCEGLDNTDDVIARIDQMFEDVEAGAPRSKVLLSTVHRAKGLEADTVWILKPEWLPFPFAKQDWEKEQEQNIRYVALTRSKRRLVFVLTPPNELSEEV